MSAFRYIITAFICLCTGMAVAGNAPDSVSQDKKITACTVLKIKGNFNVVLTQGKECSLKVTASDKDVMSSIEVKNTGSTLNITMKDGTKGGATLYIGIKDILQISITTNGTVTSSGKISSDVLALNLDGDAVVDLNLDIKELTYNSSSNKNIVLKGKVKKCTFKDMGEGNIDASELKVDNLTIDDSSDGDLKVYAHPELHVKLTGTGQFIYFGNPRTKTFHVEGSATEKQISESK